MIMDRLVEQGQEGLKDVRDLSQQRANRSVKTIDLRTIKIERYLIAIIGLVVISLTIQVYDLKRSMKTNLEAQTEFAERNVLRNWQSLSVLKDILAELKARGNNLVSVKQDLPS